MCIRDSGNSLTEEEIKIFVNGLTDKSFSDEQIAAMSMAIFSNGMTPEETVCLTEAMTNSGDTINWSEIEILSWFVISTQLVVLETRRALY